MSNLTIHIGTEGTKTTVSEMRKQLARILSKLRGDQQVGFTFSAALENYTPGTANDELCGVTLDVVLEPHTDPYTELANSLGVSRENAKALVLAEGYTFGRSTEKPAILGAPYNLDSNIELDGGAQDGLRGYAESITKPTIVMGPLAAPENN